MLKLKNENGMTLVEVVVVMVIISIALIPMLKVFTLNLQSLTSSEQKTIALLKAQEILEHEKYKVNSLSENIAKRQGSVSKEEGLKSEVSVLKKDDLYTIDVQVFYDDKKIHLITKTGDYHEQ